MFSRPMIKVPTGIHRSPMFDLWPERDGTGGVIRIYICNEGPTHRRRAAPEHSVPHQTSRRVRRGTSVPREGWRGTELRRSEHTSVTGDHRSHTHTHTSELFKTTAAHQSAQGKEPHQGTGGQQLEDRWTLRVNAGQGHSKQCPVIPTCTNLQADYVDQRLVSDVDLTEDLRDRHSGNQQVERHKEREDRGQPARKMQRK